MSERVLVQAAKAALEYDGRDIWRHLTDAERADHARMIRAALVYLADHPDRITVLAMGKTGAQAKRVRTAWKQLVLGLVETDGHYDRASN